MLLGGCGRSAVKIDAKPVSELASALAAPPASLIAACQDPVDLPDGPMSAGAVERAMAADRAALASCVERHAATVEFYRARDAGLAGVK